MIKRGVPVKLFESNLSPVESQARADLYLRIGTLGMTALVAFVAMSISAGQPVAAFVLTMAVVGQLVICFFDVLARYLRPTRRR